MKYTLFTTALLVALIFSGCKSKVTEIKIKPKTVTIKGALGKYFEVVDKEYVLKQWNPDDDKSFEIMVELKRLNNNFENELAWPNLYDVKSNFASDEGVDYHAGFGIEFLDDNSPLDILPAEKPLGCNYDMINTALRINQGETSFIKFIFEGDLEKLKSFQVTSSFEKKIK